jgi:hypothetical protein
MELALLVQVVLHQLQIKPRQQQQASSTQHQQHAASCSSSSAGAIPSRLKPSWLHDVALFGLGAAGGSSSQAAAWAASGSSSGGGSFDDAPHKDTAAGPSVGALPRCELKRLVGFKVPAEPYWVEVGARRRA